MAKEGHDIAGNTTWAASHQDDSGAEEWIKTKELREGKGHKWHNCELGKSAQQDVCGAAQDDLEIVARQSTTHREHDNAQDDRGSGTLLNPSKCLREKAAQNSCGNHYPRAVATEEKTNVLE